jgi:lysophospholipase L1-like esterase
MRSLRLALGLTTALALSVAGTATTTLSAAASHDDDDRPYLALGDSVAFGFITQAGYEYINPDNFVGYPAYVGQALRLDAADASCPGETTGGFLSSSALDNGCRAYRARAPLHVAYPSTQLEFATGFLEAHRRTRLVTLMLGANDLFLLENSCSGDLTCVSAGLPHALAAITANVQTILAALRATGFQGAIAVENYYSLDYSDATGTGITQLLNRALTAAASAQGALVADTFTAFQAAASSPFAGGSPCRAGLLNALPANQFLCDVHPSQSGQRLIAQAIRHALREALRNDEDGD